MEVPRTALRADFDGLQKKLSKGEVVVTSRTQNDSQCTVGIERVSSVASTDVFDRKTKRLPLFDGARPALQDAPLEPMRTVKIKARDGLTLPSVLTFHCPKAPTSTATVKLTRRRHLCCGRTADPGRAMVAASTPTISGWPTEGMPCFRETVGLRRVALGDTVRQSTAKVVHGAEHVPGLNEAMKR